MGGTIARHTDAGDAVRVLVVTDGSSTQYPGDAETRAQGGRGTQSRSGARRDRLRALDLPDMRLDTLAHVDVNRVIEEHVREHAPEVVHRPAGREPRPPRALRLGRGGDATDGAGRRAAPDLRADVEHGVDAVPGQLVRPQLVRRRERDDRAQDRRLRPLRDGAQEFPHPRSERAIRSTAAHHGATCGREYAEPFVLVRGLDAA